ncbi:MAG TPA: T9SS type A sorting domain-containing protein [bacterium (Candidatus Stahlbacteria)]|nr:T9SS type A sorting domain-containing protein [Candidatus Stahlbacteria bacterium]
MYARYDTSDVVIFEIGSDGGQLQEFIQVFGQRFLGLIDPGSSVYYNYRVPNPEAPYPQDYIIDQNGYVRYWSDEYDPQRIIRIIDRLLGPEVEEDDPYQAGRDRPNLEVIENPNRGLIHLVATGFSGKAVIEIYDASGRLINARTIDRPMSIILKQDLPSGAYYLLLRTEQGLTSENLIVIR